MQTNLKTITPPGRTPEWNMHPVAGSIQKSANYNNTDEAFDALISFVCACSGRTLSLNEQVELKQAAKCKTVRRGQYLLQEGDICCYFSFIVSGSLRMFSVNQRGQESILSFGTENNWLTDRESLGLMIPSKYNIEALEHTRVVQLHIAQMETLIKNIPAIAAMASRQERQEAINTQKRIHATLSMTAEERYHDLLRCHPDYPQRFSQNMLAAYLGIKPETLSRLKNR